MASLLVPDTIEPLYTDLQYVPNINNFLTKLNKCRNEINTKFKQISDNLIFRQKQLLVELDEIEKRYTESQNNNNLEISIQQLKIVINEQNIILETNFNLFSEGARSNVKELIKNLGTQIYCLREKMEIFAETEIALDTTYINALIETVGTVTLKQDWDYSQYTPHVICNDTQYLNRPRGVAIDNNGHIYVANDGTNSILVFTWTGEYMRELGKDTLIGPWGIVVHNNSLYITGSTTLYKYTLTGEMVNSITCYGVDKIQFNVASGVHVNYNGLLFVSDRGNNCIPMFDENLSHQRTLLHAFIKQPVDICTKHEQVYILTSTALHVLSEEGTYLKQIVIKCTNALFFTLDSYNNIIISDWTRSNNNIIILSLYNNNNIKHRLGLRNSSYHSSKTSYSAGIVWTNNNNIINVRRVPGSGTLQAYC